MSNSTKSIRQKAILFQLVVIFFICSFSTKTEAATSEEMEFLPNWTAEMIDAFMAIYHNYDDMAWGEVYYYDNNNFGESRPLTPDEKLDSDKLISIYRELLIRSGEFENMGLSKTELDLILSRLDVIFVKNMSEVENVAGFHTVINEYGYSRAFLPGRHSELVDCHLGAARVFIHELSHVFTANEGVCELLTSKIIGRRHSFTKDFALEYSGAADLYSVLHAVDPYTFWEIVFYDGSKEWRAEFRLDRRGEAFQIMFENQIRAITYDEFRKLWDASDLLYINNDSFLSKLQRIFSDNYSSFDFRYWLLRNLNTLLENPLDRPEDEEMAYLLSLIDAVEIHNRLWDVVHPDGDQFWGLRHFHQDFENTFDESFKELFEYNITVFTIDELRALWLIDENLKGLCTCGEGNDLDAFIFAEIYNNQNYSPDQNLTPNDLRAQLHYYYRQIIQLPLEMLDANDSRMIFINNLMSTYEEMTGEAENSSNYLYVVVILCVALGVAIFMLKSRVRVSFKPNP